MSKIEVSWDDAFAGNFPESPAQQLFTDTVISVAAQAKAALPEMNGRVDKARDLVLGGLVTRNADGTFTVRSQTERGKTYIVADNTCECPDAQKGNSPCKHIAGTWIWRKARKAIEVQQTSSTVAPQSAQAPKAELPIPPQFVVELHGKQFVTFSGLLTLAHERGLASLKADFITVTAELALAHAIATFSDGRTFEESADATPTNVNAKIRPHFPRMALTRAKARVLRDALNISMVAVEELEA
jgi:hypothetical protein